MELRIRTPRRPWLTHWPPRWSLQGKGTQNHPVHPWSRSWCLSISRCEGARILNSHGKYLWPHYRWGPPHRSEARCQGLPHLQRSWCWRGVPNSAAGNHSKLLGFPSPCYLTGQGIGWSLPRPKPPSFQSPRCFGEREPPNWCSWPKQPSHQRSSCHLSRALLSPEVLWSLGSRCHADPCALWSGSTQPCTLTSAWSGANRSLSSPGTAEKEASFKCNTCNTCAHDPDLLWNSVVFQHKGFFVDRNRRVQFQLQYQEYAGSEWYGSGWKKGLGRSTWMTYTITTCTHLTYVWITKVHACACTTYTWAIPFSILAFQNCQGTQGTTWRLPHFWCL